MHFHSPVQCWCSVSKGKHDPVFLAALLNGQKIQISLQIWDHDLESGKYGQMDITILLIFLQFEHRQKGRRLDWLDVLTYL